MASVISNRAILPWKQPRPVSGLELLISAFAIVIAFTLLRKVHAGNWAYPISFYAIFLVGHFVRLFRLIKRR